MRRIGPSIEYLGQHWAYRRPTGESQVTYNYVKALADWTNNFFLGRGVQFKSPHGTEHIVPALLKRVWEVDNEKNRTLWEIGQMGGVSGDAFVKVAWEEAYNDPSGLFHPARVRVLNLNSAYCFPEWHPHDRERLLRFKLKYKFWATSQEGTRQVYTYTEILTDEVIEEYLNDTLIEQRPNPLGVIPVVHIPNIEVSGSPWGLSDTHDIINLNREYNEKAMEISDILNYHSAPVTIITGGKASNLESGANKVWSIPSDKAKVFNLEGGTSAIGPGLEYLQTLKTSMHEMSGVPETALGQMQPISNTSGVALHIQYQPAMQRRHMKILTYEAGLKRINELILRTLYYFEPDTLLFDPATEGLITDPDEQPWILDPADPLAYQTVIHWPPPLPTDTLVALNEIQMKMELGLESKVGALEALGEQFPDEKLLEIQAELIDDAKWAGAMNFMKARIQAATLEATGIVIGEGEEEAPTPVSAGGNSGTGNTSPAPQTPPMVARDSEDLQGLMSELVTRAYGTKIPQRRSPNNDD